MKSFTFLLNYGLSKLISKRLFWSIAFFFCFHLLFVSQVNAQENKINLPQKVKIENADKAELLDDSGLLEHDKFENHDKLGRPVYIGEVPPLNLPQEYNLILLLWNSRDAKRNALFSFALSGRGFLQMIFQKSA